MENVQQRDPYFEKFINLTVDFIVSEVKERLKDFKPVDEEEKLSYVPKEAAKILGVGNNTIYNLLKDDDFPSFRINDKWYVSRKGLEDWVEKQTKK
ncbi:MULTISPECIES: helix-turn-helix domain-containing protein [unclassified Clostridium]|jgi:DNA binding domain, excisionase family|uniref:helix-turn-helix domain-containing protein n=1 Tax=unclassified Clostridium TaxID=2614128 RepID=UPI0025BEC0DB|nr:helix-turn-helix domain-containing protein [Clostridium sp.]MDY4252990.1 helix-turn-helix domain-containing protein [Clostridium sp.]